MVGYSFLLWLLYHKLYYKNVCYVLILQNCTVQCDEHNIKIWTMSRIPRVEYILGKGVL